MTNIDTTAPLREYFGFDAFRPGQEEIVLSVANGEDVLAIMPTGGGKSLCYQLPALLRHGVTVVISPLIALMRDQVRALQAAGVCAGALTSGNTAEETQAVWDAIDEDRLKLLYMAPERLASGSTMSMLRRIDVSLIAVDEAHCVSQWGHDFRPDYLRIGDLRAALDVPVAAFTATADAETRDEIIAKLFSQPPRIFLRGFDRPNIHLAFAAKNNPRAQILSFAGARRGRSGIVYCGSRAKTETLAAALRADGHAACHYHGAMEAQDRRDVEARFAREDGLIVVATVAFGMGIDKPDIRWVAHADLPKSIESYYQEIGRAGRDGAPSETLTLYGADDIRLRRSQIDESAAPTDMRAADHGRLNALLGLAEAQACRRVALLGYFGDDAEPCNFCDLCEQPPDLFDATTPVRKVLSAILRTGEWFGSGHLIDILLGNDTAKIRERGHDGLPTYGVGKEHSKAQWQAIIRQMMGRDLIRPNPERHGALHMTDAARPILRGEATLTLRRDSLKAAKSGPKTHALVSEDDAPMLSALKAKRNVLSRAANLPAYMVFNDRTLIEMAETRPSDLDAMARINGVGAKKLAQYGNEFLSVITGEAEILHPARQKLAGRPSGQIYDRLMAAQAELARGPDGLDKPLSCSAGQLAKVAGMYSADLTTLERILGDLRVERFGQAFLDVLRDTG
jgi:ATP-dependent DNA helicase RecQ